jgi:hypothetical protein
LDQQLLSRQIKKVKARCIIEEKMWPYYHLAQITINLMQTIDDETTIYEFKNPPEDFNEHEYSSAVNTKFGKSNKFASLAY